MFLIIKLNIKILFSFSIFLTLIETKLNFSVFFKIQMASKLVASREVGDDVGKYIKFQINNDFFYLVKNIIWNIFKKVVRNFLINILDKKKL